MKTYIRLIYNIDFTIAIVTLLFTLFILNIQNKRKPVNIIPKAFLTYYLTIKA